MARKEVNIDWEEVAELAQAGCNGQQIADYFGIHYNTLAARCQKDNQCDFSDILQQNRSKGDALLIVKQYESAVKDKDKSMQIWLGKQRLGQRDKFETDNKHDIQVSIKPVKFVDE
jgi:hypothetical protein